MQWDISTLDAAMSSFKAGYMYALYFVSDYLNIGDYVYFELGYHEFSR